MICEYKKTNDNSPGTICCQWFCPPLHLIPVWLNSPFPIITKKLSKIFSNTERRKLCSVRNGSSVSSVSQVLQWTRWERVPLSLYERTFFGRTRLAHSVNHPRNLDLQMHTEPKALEIKSFSCTCGQKDPSQRGAFVPNEDENANYKKSLFLH